MQRSYSSFFKNLTGVFNLTATFSLVSDFTSMYYASIGFDWKLNQSFNLDHNYLHGKTRLAFILTTNCFCQSNRLSLVHEMQKHARHHSIDIVGKCGHINYLAKQCKELSSKECRRKLSRKYMFMLAFENSLCEDYITEKFFESLLFDFVPVVYGAGDYTKWIPKSAYIDVRDFKTVSALVSYLQYLSKNATAYNLYFSWKRYIVSATPKPKLLCEMCIKLHLETIYGIKKTTVDLDAYWNPEKKCKLIKYPSNFSTFEMVNYRYSLVYYHKITSFAKVL
jgi:hypothetical protein